MKLLPRRDQIMIDYTLDNQIRDELKKRNEAESVNHKSSGKLSASMLGLPLQWQVLKIIGVPGRELDDYTLRKFQRGKEVENWLMVFLPAAEKQKFVEYRNCVGYVDALVDTSKWEQDHGTIPLEVKSVANMKFKRVEGENGADRGHKLQACFYALALNLPKFGVCYIAADDLRVKVFIYETSEIAPEVERIISVFEEQMKKKVVPVFEAAETWNSNLKYCNYPLWIGLSEAELAEKSKELFKNK